jgi:hypothetical protein
MRENVYQTQVIRRLKEEFPGCVVIKQDPEFMQGIPDLFVLFGKAWAMLEVKASESAPVRPNQGYYIEKFNEMSYASFVYPENEEKVFDELQHAFSNRG